MIIPQLQEYYKWGDYITLEELKFNISGEIPVNFPYHADRSGLPLKTVRKELGSEEYNLYVDEDGIRIEYGSERALFYSINTLKQIIRERCGKYIIPRLSIKDYPGFSIRGIIEGFYGKPWTHEDRLSLIRFSGEYKLNTFFYAPKDDPYHRMDWKKPYPVEKFSELKELTDCCRENHVDFIFSVSPGVDIAYSSDSDFGLLCEKFRSVMDLGVRKVSLLLDDISDRLKDEGDVRKFGGDFGRAQVFLANRIFEYLNNKYEDLTFIICPTEYSGFERTPYKNTIKENLNSNIIVIWTGPEVAAKRIDSEDARMEFDLYGHQMLLWDNFPVNDGSRQLKLGPVSNRCKELYRLNHAGILSNPMNQAEASKIALMTYADYSWNPEGYVPEYSMMKSLHHFESKNSKALNILCQNCQSLDMWNEFAPEFKGLVEDAIATGIYDRLADYFFEIQNLCSSMDNFGNRRFCEEIRPWLNKIRLTAELGLCSLDIIRGVDRGDFEDILNEYKNDEYSFGSDAVLDLAEYVRVKTMGMGQKLAQLIMPDAAKEDLGILTELIGDNIVGNIAIRDFYKSSDELKDMVNRLRQSCSMPLFIAADHEGGSKCILDERFAAMSSAMAVAATSTKGDAFNSAGLQAIELKTAGINMVFAPVLNLTDSNAGNSGTRTFGGEVRKNMIESALSGYNYAKMYPCVKYFPVFNDSKNTVITGDSFKLGLNVEAFKAAIKKGVPAILLSNAIVRAIDEHNPVCHSKRLVGGLLRNRLGFRGLIFAEYTGQTDIAEFFRRSMEAGADVVILRIPSQEIRSAVEKIAGCLDDDTIKLVDAAAARVLKYKDMVRDSSIDEEQASGFYRLLRAEIADHSITSLKASNKLPLISKNIVLAVQEGLPEFGKMLEDKLNNVGFEADSVMLDAVMKEGIREKGRDYVILTEGRFAGDVDRLGNLLAGCRCVIQVIAGYPEGILDFADSVIAIYDKNSEAANAAVKVLNGQLAPTGRLPVATTT